jgi:pimeloyl-ACP methyl ester carboxylesterase
VETDNKDSPCACRLGQYEEFVPLVLAQEYVAAARRAGDAVQLEVIPGVGHFETASPRAQTWPRVDSSIRALLESTDIGAKFVN